MICNRDFGSIRKEHDKGNLLVTGNLRKRALRPPPSTPLGGIGLPLTTGYIYITFTGKKESELIGLKCLYYKTVFFFIKLL